MHYPDLFIGGDRGERSRSRSGKRKKRLGYKEGEEGDATQTPGLGEERKKALEKRRKVAGEQVY